ncbi:membrane protein [Helicobacter pylori J166]|nr:membrane protein [Helicobacter pylori J166]
MILKLLFLKTGFFCFVILKLILKFYLKLIF